MNTPEAIKVHEPKYHQSAWEQYTLQELGEWVHLFTKRAGHRADPAKAAKDLDDAQNYLHMMQSHIDAAREKVKTA